MEKKITEIQALKLENCQLKMNQLNQQMRELEDQQSKVLSELKLKPQQIKLVNTKDLVIVYDETKGA